MGDIKLPCYSVLMTVYKNDNPNWVDLPNIRMYNEMNLWK